MNILSKELSQNYFSEFQGVTKSDEYQEFDNYLKSLYTRVLEIGNLPFDPRFNATHWGLDVGRLCQEIYFSICWLRAYAKTYQANVEAGSFPSHDDFQVTYYVDNAITRINSCRDKLALAVWAYYCPFNPENDKEVLNYHGVCERLQYPIKYGLKLADHEEFLEALQLLRGNDFNRLSRYRNLKIHRREPQIEIYGVEQHHGWDYMFPLLTKSDISNWKDKLKSQYPEQDLRDSVIEKCYIDGIPYESRKVKDQIWDYQEIHDFISSASSKTLKCSTKVFHELLNRPPLLESK